MNWYDRINGTGQQAQPTQPQNNGYSGMQFQNPIQKLNYIRQAMINPAAFVRSAIPNIPPDICNDPNRILAYMKQHLGVTDADIQNAMSKSRMGW